MKQKEMKMVAYVAPDVSIYEIHSEGTLCVSGVDSANNGYEDEYDLGEI